MYYMYSYKFFIILQILKGISNTILFTCIDKVFSFAKWLDPEAILTSIIYAYALVVHPGTDLAICIIHKKKKIYLDE